MQTTTTTTISAKYNHLGDSHGICKVAGPSKRLTRMGLTSPQGGMMFQRAGATTEKTHHLVPIKLNSLADGTHKVCFPVFTESCKIIDFHVCKMLLIVGRQDYFKDPFNLMRFISPFSY